MYQILVRTKSGGTHFSKPSDQSYDEMDERVGSTVRRLHELNYIRVDNELGGVDFIRAEQVESISFAEYDQHPF